MFLLATTVLLPSTAGAMASFALGIPDDVAHHGLAYGTAWNHSSRESADADALSSCRGFTGAPDDTRALCKVVAHFDHQCLAISMDPKAGTPGYGWAIADTESAASEQALQHCQDTAGADRTAYCESSEAECDTTP